VLKISKSAFDGTFGNKEFLRELRMRLIRGKLKIEEVDEVLDEYWENQPKPKCSKCKSDMPHHDLKELGRTECPSCWLEAKEAKTQARAKGQ